MIKYAKAILRDCHIPEVIWDVALDSLIREWRRYKGKDKRAVAAGELRRLLASHYDVPVRSVPKDLAQIQAWIDFREDENVTFEIGGAGEVTEYGHSPSDYHNYWFAIENEVCPCCSSSKGVFESGNVHCHTCGFKAS